MGKLQDYFIFTLETFSHRRLRSFLTVLGIFIGIAAVVTLITLAQGFEAAINDQFAMMGENKVMIMPGSMTSAAGLSSMMTRELTDHDLDTVKSVPLIDKAAGMSAKLAQVKMGDQVINTFVSGLPTDWNILTMYTGVTIDKGRYFKPTDKYKVGVGWLYTQDTYIKKPLKIGDKIEINGYTFEVIALVSKIGNPSDDANIYITLDDVKTVFNSTGGYMVILAQTKMGADTAKVAEQVKTALRKDKGEKAGEETFEVQTMDDLKRVYSSIIGVVEFVVIGVAAISLIVGGIGIMNSMYTAILERTRDIGIMKAIGARNSDIVMIFLIEAGMFGLVGGLLGIAGGLGLAKLVEFYALQMGVTLLKVSFEPWLIIGALAFSFIIGVISGLVPALKAAKMSPVDALRYE
jgi:putative ABC transport system permease protein